MAWSGPLALAALLAVVAGAAKLRRPQPVVVALRGSGMAFVTRALVRAGSVLEVMLGGVALGSGWRPAVLGLAVSYVAFAGFVALARSRPAIASCGCFGERGSPPSWRHVIVDLGLAAGCVGAALSATPGIGTVLGHQPVDGAPFTAVVLLAVWLSYVVLAGPHLDAPNAPGPSR